VEISSTRWPNTRGVRVATVSIAWGTLAFTIPATSFPLVSWRTVLSRCARRSHASAFRLASGRLSRSCFPCSTITGVAMATIPPTTPKVRSTVSTTASARGITGRTSPPGRRTPPR
jgi:hypothetical protein